MSDHSDLLAEAGQEDLFEKEMRGYSRRRVDEYVAKNRSQIRDLEDRLSRELDNSERLRLELSTARQASEEKPAHEEISERVGQILKLADDEAKAQRDRASDELAKLRADVKEQTDKLRADAKQETDKVRAEAHEQAERMLSAAQEQAEHSIASAKAEADKTRNAARTEAERAVADANKHAESSVSAAKAQAKQQLDEATARATAIHDGAERRLNLLMSRHVEAIRRLTEIRDVVTTLVAGEASRGSLEDEVNKAVAGVIGAAEGKGGPQAAGPQAAGLVAAAGPGQPAPASRPVNSPAGAGPAGGAARPGENRGEMHGAGNGHGSGDGPPAGSGRPGGVLPGARGGNGIQADNDSRQGTSHQGETEPAKRAGAAPPASGIRTPEASASDTEQNARIVE
jgi:F0F1-type ATP synthase membrane subunit b/b'